MIAKCYQGKGSDKALGTSERWTDGGMKLMKPSHSRPRWVREILKEHFPGRQVDEINHLYDLQDGVTLGTELCNMIHMQNDFQI